MIHAREFSNASEMRAAAVAVRNRVWPVAAKPRAEISPLAPVRRRATCLDQKAYIAEMVAQGLSNGAIGQRIGVTGDAVRKFLVRNGMDKAVSGRIKEHEAQVSEMHGRGESGRAIARALGFDNKTVSRFIKKQGWTR